MGNLSLANHAARTRRAYIEHSAHHFGHLNRGDVKRIFGVSSAQASADIAAVMAEHPGCLIYDPQARCYLWDKGRKPKFEIPPPIAAFEFSS